MCESPIYESARIKLFRPDVSKHAVSKVIKGNRYLLSIGLGNKFITSGCCGRGLEPSIRFQERQHRLQRKSSGNERERSFDSV